jgi:hypothetical protein
LDLRATFALTFAGIAEFSAPENSGGGGLSGSPPRAILRPMKTFGQLWTLVLAGPGTEREASSVVGSVVNRAARTAHRERVWAVVTEQDRRELKGPLWFLPASNFVVVPDHASTIYGIVQGLLRILQRDPAARVVLLPERQSRTLDSLRVMAGSARELLDLYRDALPQNEQRQELVA